MDTSLRARATLIRRGWMLLEAGVTTAAFLGALRLHDALLATLGTTASLRSHLPLLIVILPLWLVLLSGLHMYSTQRLTTVQGQWAGLLKAHCFGGTVIAVVMVVGKLEWVDRSAVLLFLSVCTAPGSLDTHLCYAAWRSSYSSRASIGV